MTIEKTPVAMKNIKINILPKNLYDPYDVNNDELYFVEDESNVWLIAVDNTEPTSASSGDRYFNTTTNLIYTYDGSAWSVTGEEPDTDSLYIDSSNNRTYVYNGTTLILVGGGGGAVDIDETSITLNSSNKIQASGTINQNSNNGVVYNWIGTKQEYDDLQEIHENWIYYITDDDEDSGSSLNDVYNRLNRAYAWTYRHVNGTGNLYNIYYDGSSYISSDAFSTIDVIGPSTIDNMSNHIICDGKLYHTTVSGNTVTRTQVGSDTTWSYLSGCTSNNGYQYTIAINNGDLYYVNGTTATLRNSGGWQKISDYSNSSSAKFFGIKNDSLYMITDAGNTITLLNSSGIWTEISGFTSSASVYGIGIKDGKLYSISYDGVITEISSDNTWTLISGYDGLSSSISNFGLGINNGALYGIKYNGVYLLDDTETWIKCTGFNNNNTFAITSTGKLYQITSINPASLTQIGTDTTWTDITGYSNTSFGINNGDVYINLQSPTKLTQYGGINKVFGNLRANINYACGYYWTGSVTEDVHTVYTVPGPQTGFHTYSDENLTQSSIITAVNTNNNTITDGNYTYTRNSSLDRVFTSVSQDSRQQLISMADLLNAIKG